MHAQPALTFAGHGCNHPGTHTHPHFVLLECPISCLCWCACTLVCAAVVCATPAVESPGSCRGGAGSIPAVRVAALPKKRLQVPGCSECAPLPSLPGFKTRKPRALPEGAVVRFLWLVSGVGGE